MYSYEDRIRAVKLYIKLGMRRKSTPLERSKLRCLCRFNSKGWFCPFDDVENRGAESA